MAKAAKSRRQTIDDDFSPPIGANGYSVSPSSRPGKSTPMAQSSSRKDSEAPAKSKSLVQELAVWYVETILGRKFDYRLDMRFLGEAKRLVNPKPDPDTGETPPAFEVDDIKECLLALKEGTHPGLNGRRFDKVSFFTLTLGEAEPFIVQWTKIPPMPPYYEGVGYDDWVRRIGKRAIEQGLWDGMYRGWSLRRTPWNETAITFSELKEIVGPRQATQALNEIGELLAQAKRLGFPMR